jgi:hypothetical protein
LIGIFMAQVYPPDFTPANESKRLTYESLLESKKQG